MLDLILELIKRAMEKDEKSRKFAVTLADSYLRRISRFQDQLVLLGIFLNFLAVGYILKFPRDCVCPLTSGIASGLGIFAVNLLLAKLYSNEHLTTKLLFARYPELELIMVGDKSWSNFRVLTAVYKFVQAGWILYAALLTGSSVSCWFGG
jgi:hypothetical protein